MTDRSPEEIRKHYEDLLASGKPLARVEVDLPMTVFIEPEGGLSIDTATYGLVGFDRLGINRVHLTQLAVDSLKRAFSEFEKNPDMKTLKILKPSSN